MSPPNSIRTSITTTPLQMFSFRLDISRLSIVLGVFSLISFCAAVQSIFFPRQPRALELDINRLNALLKKIDSRAVLLPSLPATRGNELALSHQLRWRLHNGNDIILVHASVRQRLNFQTAFITKNLTFLSMSRRHSDYPLNGSDSGYILGRPSFQTCYFLQSPTPSFATQRSALVSSYDALASTSRHPLMQFVGLQPSLSYDCLLVTLRGSAKQPISLDLWNKILMQFRYIKAGQLTQNSKSLLF